MESEDKAKVAWKEKRELAHQSGGSVRGTDSLHSSPPRETLLCPHNLPLPLRCQLPTPALDVLAQRLRRTTPHIRVPQPLVLARRIPKETNEEATMPVLDRVRENRLNRPRLCGSIGGGREGGSRELACREANVVVWEVGSEIGGVESRVHAEVGGKGDVVVGGGRKCGCDGERARNRGRNLRVIDAGKARPLVST